MRKVGLYILFILLVISNFTSSFTLPIVLNALILVIIIPTAFEKLFLKKCIYLLIPILLGFIFCINKDVRDIVRDLYYFIYPLAFAFMGYSLSKRFSFSEILSMFITLGTLYSFFFFISIFTILGPGGFSDFIAIRNEVSAGNILPVLAIIIIVFRKRFQLPIKPQKLFANFILAVNVIAFILFGSRTFLLILLIFLFYMFFNKLNLKFVLTLITLVMLASFLFIFLKTENFGSTSFIGKTMSSFTELSMDVDFDEHTINTQYRGFETYMAIQTFSGGSLIQKFVGQGFGAMVDLKVYVTLGEDPRRYVPLLHNGLLYSLVKTGILGMLFHAIYFYSFFKSKGGHRNLEGLQVAFVSKMTKAAVISVLIGTILVGGLFNPGFQMVQVFLTSIYFSNLDNNEESYY